MTSLIAGVLGMIVLSDNAKKPTIQVLFPKVKVAKNSSGVYEETPEGFSGPWKVESTEHKDLLRIGAIREYLGLDKGTLELKGWERKEYELNGPGVACIYIVKGSANEAPTAPTQNTDKVKGVKIAG